MSSSLHFKIGYQENYSDGEMSKLLRIVIKKFPKFIYVA